MNTSYLTETTITDTHIIVKSSIGNQVKTNIVARGPNEDTDLRAASVAHKQLADNTLATDSPERIRARAEATIAEEG